MKIFYDVPYMKAIMLYVLVPVVVVLTVVGISLYVYSKKHEDHSDPHYNFVMNFWSSLIGVVVTAVILAIAVAFSVTMTERMEEYNLVEDKKMIYYLLKYFIVIPIVFVIWYIIKLLKTIYHKPSKKKELQQEAANTTSVVRPSNTVPTPPIETVNKAADLEKTGGLPSMDESLQSEIKEFEEKNTKTKEAQEPEVISIEEDIK